ncbi:MAG: hypothetical protein IJ361_07975 [Spirochaetaceae bacterium]|nr:hypothetical protein [Spirochaetaceae bacterium]
MKNYTISQQKLFQNRSHKIFVIALGYTTENYPTRSKVRKPLEEIATYIE